MKPEEEPNFGVSNYDRLYQTYRCVYCDQVIALNCSVAERMAKQAIQLLTWDVYGKLEFYKWSQEELADEFMEKEGGFEMADGQYIHDRCNKLILDMGEPESSRLFGLINEHSHWNITIPETLDKSKDNPFTIIYLDFRRSPYARTAWHCVFCQGLLSGDDQGFAYELKAVGKDSLTYIHFRHYYEVRDLQMRERGRHKRVIPTSPPVGVIDFAKAREIVQEVVQEPAGKSEEESEEDVGDGNGVDEVSRVEEPKIGQKQQEQADGTEDYEEVTDKYTGRKKRWNTLTRRWREFDEDTERWVYQNPTKNQWDILNIDTNQWNKVEMGESRRFIIDQSQIIQNIAVPIGGAWDTHAEKIWNSMEGAFFVSINPENKLDVAFQKPGTNQWFVSENEQWEEVTLNRYYNDGNYFYVTLNEEVEEEVEEEEKEGKYQDQEITDKELGIKKYWDGLTHKWRVFDNPTERWVYDNKEDGWEYIDPYEDDKWSEVKFDRDSNRFPVPEAQSKVIERVRKGHDGYDWYWHVRVGTWSVPLEKGGLAFRQPETGRWFVYQNGEWKPVELLRWNGQDKTRKWEYISKTSFVSANLSSEKKDDESSDDIIELAWPDSEHGSTTAPKTTDDLSLDESEIRTFYRKAMSDLRKAIASGDEMDTYVNREILEHHRDQTKEMQQEEHRKLYHYITGSPGVDSGERCDARKRRESAPGKHGPCDSCM